MVLDKNETLLIEAYKEQTASWKHEDSLFHRFTSIILPLSVVMLGVPYVQERREDCTAGTYRRNATNDILGHLIPNNAHQR